MVLTLLLLLLVLKELVQSTLNVVPTSPVVNVAIIERAAGLWCSRVVCSVGTIAIHVDLVEVGACVTAGPYPCLICAALEISARVRQHLLVSFQSLPGDPGTKSQDEFVQEERQMTSASDVVLA